MPAAIRSATMYDDRNFVVYDDSDSSTDYSHSYSLPTRDAIKWIRRDGADRVELRPINASTDPKFAKRARRIAKAAGYDVAAVSTVSPFGVRDSRFELTRRAAA